VTAPSDGDAALADGLREAQRRVAALDVEPAVKERVFHRLLAISDAAKRDTARAAARLARFERDLDEGRVAASGDAEPPA
jgi:hypothetical protein